MCESYKNCDFVGRERSTQHSGRLISKQEFLNYGLAFEVIFIADTNIYNIRTFAWFTSKFNGFIGRDFVMLLVLCIMICFKGSA